MPYCFGSAGGHVITTPAGTAVTCASGDGKPAVDIEYGLNVCQNCRNNIKVQENIVGAGKLGSANTVLAFIVTNKNTNLRGT